MTRGFKDKGTIKKYMPHILIWCALIIYIIFANSIYCKFVLKNGKPVFDNLLKSTEILDSIYYIDGLDQVRYDGQDLYLLKGWGFRVSPSELSLQDFSKQIILQKDEEIKLFAAQDIPRPGLNIAVKGKDPEMDITYAGFQSYISKEVLPLGIYRIGIRYISDNGVLDYYFWTSKGIEITPNKMILVDIGK